MTRYVILQSNKKNALIRFSKISLSQSVTEKNRKSLKPVDSKPDMIYVMYTKQD